MPDDSTGTPHQAGYHAKDCAMRCGSKRQCLKNARDVADVMVRAFPSSARIRTGCRSDIIASPPQLVAAVHSFNSLPTKPWITALTIPTIQAAAILGLRLRKPTGRLSVSPRPTMFRHPRCLRRLPRMAKTASSTATWASRMRTADQARRLRMAISRSNNRRTARTRLDHLNRRSRASTGNSRRGTMGTGRSDSSSSTSCKPRSQGLSGMERRTLYCDSMFTYVYPHSTWQISTFEA